MSSVSGALFRREKPVQPRYEMRPDRRPDTTPARASQRPAGLKAPWHRPVLGVSRKRGVSVSARPVSSASSAGSVFRRETTGKEDTMSQTKSRPALTITDGALKAVIWKNEREGKCPVFSVTFSQTYRGEDGRFHDRRSFAGADLLRLARLAGRAYDAARAASQHEPAQDLDPGNSAARS